MSYSDEFKKEVVDFYYDNPVVSMRVVAKRFKIPHKTLGVWIRLGDEFHMSLKNRTDKDKNWSNIDKFKAVMKFETLNKDEKGKFLREHGLYSNQINEWKKSMLSGFSKEENENNEIKRLKEKLQGKEAIIELQKKTQKLLDQEEE